MKVNQIYSFINAVSNEIWGTASPSVKDLRGLISLGETLGAGGTWTDSADNYLNKIIDKVGKTVIRTLERRVDLPKFIQEDFVFGAVLEKLDVQPIQAQKDNSWNIGAEDFSSDYLNIYKPNVSTTLFKGIDSWTVKTTIPDILFRSAFKSEAAMTSFINAIMDSMSGSLEAQVNKMNHIALANLIAEKIKNSYNGVIGLVTLYNTTFNLSSGDTGYVAPGETALYNKDFLQFASYTINNYVSYMGDEGTFYNVGDKIRATARDNMHVIMLKPFASACGSYLESGTFHKELVSLPMYTEINYIQYNAQADFETKSGIMIIPASNAEDDTTAVTVPNIVGVLADRMAIGTTIYDKWAANDRFNSERRTNFTQGANIGWFNDISENAVVFTLN